MSDDWRPGDLALCVDDGPAKRIKGRLEVRADWLKNLKAGSVYTVSQVLIGSSGAVGICDRVRHAGGISSRFRKITPGHKIEDFEEPRRLPVKEKADA